MSPLSRSAVWGGGLVLLVVAYQSLWQPAMWVYNDRALAHPALTSLTTSRILATATWAMTETPMSARLLNLVFHGCNAVLVGLLMRRMGLTEWLAAVVALAWALHPLQVESVAYAAGRSELLAATGVLIVVLAAIANGRGWWAWALVGLGVGLAAKESAIVALALVPLLRATVGHRWRVTTTACAVATLAAVVWFGGPRAIVNQELYATQVSMYEWGLVQATAIVRLVWLSVIPIGQTIDFDYDVVPHSVRVLALFALLAWVGLAWRMRHARPLVAAGFAWTLLAVAPRLIVQTPRSYLNEHQFYLPFVGLALAAGSALSSLSRKESHVALESV